MRALFLALVLLTACSTQALEANASAAKVIATTLDGARAAIEAADLAAELEIVEHAENRVDAQREVIAVRQRYDAVIAAYNLARSAHAAYVEAIRDAASAHASDVSPSARRHLVEAWQVLAAAAEALGVEIPKPPPEVVALIGGAS